MAFELSNKGAAWRVMAVSAVIVACSAGARTAHAEEGAAQSPNVGAPSVESPSVGAPTVETEPADGFRGIWYAVGPENPTYGYKYSGGLGTYCAKHNPFAVYRPEVDKTFFCYGGTTADSHTRLVHMVSYFDHATGRVARPRQLLDKQTNDAHDNPVLSVDDEGYIWVFSTSHGRGRPSFIHRSVKPYDIARFQRVDATYQQEGRETPLENFSYLQMWRTPAHGFTAFFTSYGNPAARTSMFMTSRDGQKWSSWKRIAAIENGHYQISTVDGDRAACAFNYHPREVGLDGRTNLYFVQTRDGGETWRNAREELVELPLTASDNPCLVHDFESQGRNVYIKDMRFDPTGAPVLLVLSSGGHEPGPSNDPRRWELFRHEGQAWRRSIVAESDNNYDMGSLYFEGDRWRVLAPTGDGPQPHAPGGEVASWVSADLGKTWRFDRDLTGASELNHTYVRRPVDAHDDFYAFWADGNGREPSKSRLYFADRAGNVYRLPERMSTDFQKPTKLPPAGQAERHIPVTTAVAPPHAE